ncbi:MAG: EAL domain-containing protein [Betaproteobacteria bacterium]|nr:EAL domain-containing protein [Betaproteobacteria bacterium]
MRSIKPNNAAAEAGVMGRRQIATCANHASSGGVRSAPINGRPHLAVSAAVESTENHGDQESPVVPRILVVDDNSDILALFSKILGGGSSTSARTLEQLEASLLGVDVPEIPDQPRFQLDVTNSGEDGRAKAIAARLEGRPYRVAFVDMRMPGGWNGLETIEALWEADPDIQVVICSAYNDYSRNEIVGRRGRSDNLLILRKPFEAIEVLQCACALSDKWSLHREREVRLNELEQRIEERTRQLQYQATHDALTGLPNRTLFMDRLQQRIAYAKRHGGRIVVCLIDLDHFKFVNDSLGHGRGDQLLKTVSDRMSGCLRESDTIARFGGDEFVLLLSAPHEPEDAMQILRRLVASLSQPVVLGGQEVIVTCSVGCSTYPEDGSDANALLKFADAAMYCAKEIGRNGIQVYNDRLRGRIDERIKLESELRRALDRGQLVLDYQPQVDLRTGRIVGMESLLRWKHPEFGLVAPGRFIPIAEEIGVIVPLTEWVLRQACVQNKAWQEAGLPPVQMAVNLSMKQLRRLKLDSLVAQCLASSRLDPGFLELEVTESATMEDPEATILLMRALKKCGVGITIDDFGTGFSNLRYLRQFPVDKLKLDGSFVRDIASDAGSLAIADAIIAMAHRLNLKVVAEMAETEEQVACLVSHGCDYVQGYYFGRPVGADECARLLRSGPFPVPGHTGAASARDRTARGLQLGDSASRP